MTSCKPLGQGAAITSIDELAPDVLPGATADLVLAGTAYPVALNRINHGDTLELDLVSHGEVLEAERYQRGPSSFALLDAAEEHFKPGIPLLKFPLRVGESWTWRGNMTTGLIPRSATATIATASDSVFLTDTSHDTVRTTVDLSFEADPGKAPLKRQLIFWFEPKAGIVKRQFGTASVRQPSKR